MRICRLDWDFEALANQLNEPVLGKIKISLLQALEEEAGPDETTTDVYFSKAIYSSQESKNILSPKSFFSATYQAVGAGQ